MTVGAVVACGGSDAAQEATVADLPRLVLQAPDTPSGYRVSHGENEGLGLSGPDEYGASAGYAIQYEKAAESAVPNDLACVVSSSGLYGSTEDARDGLSQLDIAAADAGLVRIDPPVVGEKAIAYRSISDSAVFCSSYENVPAESYNIAFTVANVVAVVSLTYLEEGNGSDEPIEYAQRQVDTIRQVLE